jgi:hypothetical protein
VTLSSHLSPQERQVLALLVPTRWLSVFAHLHWPGNSRSHQRPCRSSPNFSHIHSGNKTSHFRNPCCVMCSPEPTQQLSSGPSLCGTLAAHWPLPPSVAASSGTGRKSPCSHERGCGLCWLAEDNTSLQTLETTASVIGTDWQADSASPTPTKPDSLERGPGICNQANSPYWYLRTPGPGQPRILPQVRDALLHSLWGLSLTHAGLSLRRDQKTFLPGLVHHSLCGSYSTLPL